MCVLMNESVRIQMARGNDTEQLKEDRFVVLLEQMNFLQSKVMGFDCATKNGN